MAKNSKGLDTPKEFEEGTDFYQGSGEDKTDAGFMRFPTAVAAPKKLGLKDYLLALIGLVLILIALGVSGGIVWKIAKWIAS